MKRILVTGENSYIGTSFVTYMEDYRDIYDVETISVREDEWKEKDFSGYDVIFHVAGIAHQKETENNKQDYYDVNYILTKELAEKAKKEGVKQFVFLSSISVYGITIGTIDETTKINPSNHYGKSKLLAEKELVKLKSETFLVTIIRPPMVYGKKCRGNYIRLREMVLKYKIFPNVDNERSMIYIENLSCFVKMVMDLEIEGTLCPQNNEYVNSKDLVKEIARNNNTKIYLIPFYYNQNNKIFNLSPLKKLLGSLTISHEMSYVGFSDDQKKEFINNTISFSNSITQTEKEKDKYE